MTYTFYELLWLFFAYSFAGWILETVAAAVKKRTFVNRGLVNGPLCVTYGAAAAAMTLSCRELSGFWLFAGIVILATLTQWIAVMCWSGCTMKNGGTIPGCHGTWTAISVCLPPQSGAFWAFWRSDGGIPC